MSEDIGSFFVPYYNISIPNPTPFYPTIKQETDGSFKITFNQGYVIDFSTPHPKTIKVEKCSDELTIEDGGVFYVKVEYKQDLTTVTPLDGIILKASVEKMTQEEVDAAGALIKLYLICEIGKEGDIKSVYLRENIIVGGKVFFCIDESGLPKKYLLNGFMYPDD